MFWGGRNYLLKEVKETFLAEGSSGVRQWKYERDWQIQGAGKNIKYAICVRTEGNEAEKCDR